MSALPIARTCGDCQACCYTTAVSSDEPKIEKRAWKKCKSQGPDGCRIYSTRPSCCATYTCDWIAGELEDGDRPDLIGLVAERFAIRGPRIGVVKVVTIAEVRAGAADSPAAKRVFDRYVAEGTAVLVTRARDREPSMVIDPGGRLELAQADVAEHGMMTHLGADRSLLR